MKPLLLTIICSLILISCKEDDEKPNTVNLNITASSNADARSSYSYAKSPDIHVSNFSFVGDGTSGNLRDAIAYIDADGNGLTDVFFGTGEFLSQSEVKCLLALNMGNDFYEYSTVEFNGNMPPTTHARKSLVSDFDNNGLLDIIVLDHGFDRDPFPGAQPKFIVQNSVGNFSWEKLMPAGFHHGGAAGDVDNDGDVDVFIGGFEPFFLINDGNASFEVVSDRFDGVYQIFTAELIDLDKDGFLDLLVGANEQDGIATRIYWGSTTGSYNESSQTIIPAFNDYGNVLDFDIIDYNSDNKLDLVINRTGGGASNNYQGSMIQLLENVGNREFNDNTSIIDNPGNSEDGWFPWLRVQDFDSDGDMDIFPDDKSINFQLIYNGSNFIRQ